MLSSFTGDGEEAGQGLADHLGGGFAGRIAGMGGKGGPIGAAIAGALAVQIGVPLDAGKRIAELAFEGMQMQAERLVTKAQFGLSAEQFAIVGKAAGAAYVGNFGESVNVNMQAAGLAIQAGLLDGNATAEQMQPVIEKLQTVSTLLGTDVSENARAAGQLIKTGLAKDATEAFDLMVVAQQKGLNLSGDLTDTIVEYSTQYRKLGIDGATALGTISQMLQGGARDSDLAADALKEFSLRVISGDEATTTAFTDLGLNAEKTATEFGKGGKAALTMSDTVIKALAKVQDPVKRNEIGVALFGTQWEDLGAAIDKVDLTKASDEMGKFGGATDRASKDMSNGATSIESAKRAIETSVDGMKMQLGEAWSPAFAQLADWVTAHQDEIVSFFTNVGKVAGVTLGGIVAGAGTTVSALGIMVTVIGGQMELVAKAFGYVARTIGQVMEKIPGMEGAGKSLKDMGQMALDHSADIRKFGQEMTGAGWEVSKFGGKLGALAYQIDQMPADKPINISAPGGQEVLDELTKLGIKATTDNEKNIVIEAPNAPGVLSQLQALGLEVETRNGKTVIVKADDVDYQTKKADWVKEETKKLWISIQKQNAATPNDIGTGFLGQRASGGPIRGPGTGTSDEVPILASNGEFMIQTAAVQKYGLPFMYAVNAGRLATGGAVGIDGYGLAPGTQIGQGGTGFPDWVYELGKAHNVQPSTYAGHQTGEGSGGAAYGYQGNPQGLNRGIDWWGSTADLQAFADYLMSIASSQSGLEQVIWWNPQTGQKAGWAGRKNVTNEGYYNYPQGYPDHTDHVHTRFNAPIMATGITLDSSGSGTALSDADKLALKQKFDRDELAFEQKKDDQLAALKSEYADRIKAKTPGAEDEYERKKKAIEDQYDSDKLSREQELDRKLAAGSDDGSGSGSGLSDAEKLALKQKFDQDELAYKKKYDDSLAALKAEYEPKVKAKVPGAQAEWDRKKLELKQTYENEKLARKQELDRKLSAGSGNKSDGDKESPAEKNDRELASTISGRFSDAAKTAIDEQITDILGVIGLPDEISWLKAQSLFEKSQEATRKLNKEQKEWLSGNKGSGAPGDKTQPSNMLGGSNFGYNTDLTGITDAEQTGAKDPGENKKVVQAGFRKYGWDQGQLWIDADALLKKESGYQNAIAYQGPVNSDAYGMFQFLSTTWAGVGGHKTDDPRLQTIYGRQYIKNRYGDPSKALAHHLANNWYDDGGVAHGKGWMGKNIIEPERILSPRQNDAFEEMVRANFRPMGRPAIDYVDTDGRGGRSGVTNNFITNATFRDEKSYYEATRRSQRTLVTRAGVVTSA